VFLDDDKRYPGADECSDENGILNLDDNDDDRPVKMNPGQRI